MSYKYVCVLIPTLNEEESIEPVIREFKALGFENILVADGHSTDGTVAKAKAAGARIFIQSGSGKGQALEEGLRRDRRGVYPSYRRGRYLPSSRGRKRPGAGSEGKGRPRGGKEVGNVQGGALKRLNMFGNKMINLFFATIYRVHLTDILSGYRAFTSEGIRRLDLSTPGFEIESGV